MDKLELKERILACTSIEQGKKLIELGLDPDTCDMTWHNHGEGMYLAAPTTVEGWKFSVQGKILNDTIPGTCIPAWSLTMLLKIITDEIASRKSDKIHFCICTEMEDGVVMPRAYFYEKAKVIAQFNGENYLDVVVKSMCSLLEKGYIKKAC